MRSLGRKAAAIAMLGLAFELAGCGARGAPTLSVFGAYFPGWLLCGVLGLLAAVGTRILIGVTGLSSAVPAQLLVCTAVGVIIASLGWLWLGQ